jgi:hypothetical protein
VLLGREERNVPLPFEALFASYGMPHVFRPQESLEAYGDNPWLGGAVDRIAHELARTKFHLQSVDEDEKSRSFTTTKLSPRFDGHNPRRRVKRR